MYWYKERTKNQNKVFQFSCKNVLISQKLVKVIIPCLHTCDLSSESLRSCIVFHFFPRPLSEQIFTPRLWVSRVLERCHSEVFWVRNHPKWSKGVTASGWPFAILGKTLLLGKLRRSTPACGRHVISSHNYLVFLDDTVALSDQSCACIVGGTSVSIGESQGLVMVW